ncbi:Small glutamine-rich tetratricopeptide repeat-containing protein alpha [Fasciolopsis buskii]|uniref:Small glutamine-rich tetratricopeptide repeat-containing protein alpha n=1 Tax=Fasciolopsis buskii TaxID=27845 RepID=A0A8E0S436_9TREM|nr:Small glutamine-rich tetratricopeptide repeat-containing protein alpha [Fasciolopsis buski]
MAVDRNVLLLYKSIAHFLRAEIESKKYSSEINESLEVAKQCLESAFGFTTDGVETIPDLLRLFGSTEVTPSAPEPSEKEKKEAEEFKIQDNRFEEAVSCYSKAIKLWPSNAVYYCNRAAAFSRIDRQDKAIEDCRTALRIDPKYSKAYGRMGVAYSNLGDYAKAAEAYRKGLELDPTNESCQQNLILAEERLKASGGVGGTGAQSGPGGLGGFDLGALLNNPMMQNMAYQLMRDPNTQNLMTRLFRDTFGSTGGPPESSGAPPPPESQTDAGNAPPPTAGGGRADPVVLDQFMRVTQQLGQQLRDGNPQLFDQLRQSFTGPCGPQGSQNTGGDGAHSQ